MKDLLRMIPFLNLYPLGVQIIIFFLVFIIVMLLVFVPRNPQIESKDPMPGNNQTASGNRNVLIGSVNGDVVMGNKTVSTYVAVITDREIRKKFPDELTFYGSEEIDFNSSKKMVFESSQAQALIEIVIKKIYLKGDKFYTAFSVNLFDKMNNTDWLDLHTETEVSRGKIAVARTDRFDLYLHIIETELVKAKISIGVKMVSRGHIMKNLRIKGNVFKFESSDSL